MKHGASRYRTLSARARGRVLLAHDLHASAQLLLAHALSVAEAARLARVLHGLVDDLIAARNTMKARSLRPRRLRAEPGEATR